MNDWIDQLQAMSPQQWQDVGTYVLGVLGSGAAAAIVLQVVRHLKGWTGLRATQVKGRITAVLNLLNGLTTLFPALFILHDSGLFALGGTFGLVYWASQLIFRILISPIYKKYETDVREALNPNEAFNLPPTVTPVTTEFKS